MFRIFLALIPGFSNSVQFVAFTDMGDFFCWFKNKLVVKCPFCVVIKVFEQLEMEVRYLHFVTHCEVHNTDPALHH